MKLQGIKIDYEYWGMLVENVAKVEVEEDMLWWASSGNREYLFCDIGYQQNSLSGFVCGVHLRSEEEEDDYLWVKIDLMVKIK